MLFVFSLTILLPLFMIMMLLIIGSYLLIALLASLPVKIMRRSEKNREASYSERTYNAVAVLSILAGLLISLALFQVSRPFYAATADVWCGIEGSLDGTGRKLDSCERRFRWLNR